MNFKRLSYFIMTFSFVLIISGGVSSFLTGLRKDREEISRRQVEIGDVFETFSTNTSIFEQERDQLYEEVLTKLYYDSMYHEDKEVKERLSNYEHLVDELWKSTKELDHLCSHIYFPDSSINSKCKNYQVIYEQVVNYFITDINKYNKNIEKYNQYQEELETLYRLRKYDTDKEYVDYNRDKKYDGKEE